MAYRRRRTFSKKRFRAQKRKNKRYNTYRVQRGGIRM